MIMFQGVYGWTGTETGQLKKRIDAMIARIAQQCPNVDTIAFRGSSGCAAGFSAAMALGKRMLYVRKDDEESHGVNVECNAQGDVHEYIIVDDFIDTGATIQSIITGIDEYIDQHAHHSGIPADHIDVKYAQCVGIFLFDTETDGTFAPCYQHRKRAGAHWEVIPTYGSPIRD